MHNINNSLTKRSMLRGKVSNTLFDMKKNWRMYVLLAPFLLLFILFTVLPVLSSMFLSFTYFNGLSAPRFIGWDNYVRLLLNDDIFLIAVRNTLVFALITGPVSYFACFVFAWIINELPAKIRSVLTLFFYAPSISGQAYLIWTIIFSGDSYGLANSFLMKFGFISQPIVWLKDPRYMLTIIIIVQLWLSLGTSFLSFIGGLQTLDNTLFEAGAIDGIRNRWQELWYITLPSMKPFLMFGAVMQITQSFAVSDVATALAGMPSTDYAAHTVITHLQDYGGIRFEIGYASAIATLLFIVMVGVNKIVQKILGKLGK